MAVDISLLRKTRVFVYGTLKRGHGNYQRLLTDALFIGNATTVDDALVMGYAGFPVVMRYEDVSFQHRPGRISGEVFCVNESELRSLDRLEGEGRMYLRRCVMVQVEDRGVIRCNTYIGNPKYWVNNLGRMTIPAMPLVRDTYSWPPEAGWQGAA